MKKFIPYSLIIVLCCCFVFSANAKITLPALISDGMVLQQQASDPLWGWASPGEEISVTGSWNGKTITARTNRYGKWMTKIKTSKAGGPYTLTIKGSETVVLHNVMIGEVWLCSGQSNMEMPVSGWPSASILHSKEEIKNADYPDIHLFTVSRDVAITPQKDVEGSWAATTPKTVAGFSATAYFFGRQLHKKLGVPIGLIHSSWGGTVVEAWTSNNELRKAGDFDNALNKLEIMQPNVQKIKRKDRRRKEAWEKASQKVHKAWAARAYDDSGWKQMMLPTVWEQAGHPDLDGVVWFRKTIHIPESLNGKPLKLDLGPVDDNDITWFNGHKVGSTNGFNVQRSYSIPGRFVKSGTNEIAVRVVDTQGNGGLYGKEKMLKLYGAQSASPAGPVISVAGNWKYHIAAVKKPTLAISNPNTPSVLYNGMIAPLIPYHIRGAIWYQGEANVGRANQYEKLFPDMIRDWRNRWKAGAFPFYFVQIAPFPYGGNGMKAAALRDAQRKTLSLPHTGMAVTMGIGDTTNIHPANKQEVGRRLSLWALSKTYGKKNIVYSGPLYDNMQVKGEKAVLSFSHVDGGLVAKNGKLTGFGIAGDDDRFVDAQAVIKDKEVVVQAAGVAHPTAVRYAWKDTAQPSLFNQAGLPASSFNTSKSTK